jgi:hypothetical protein
VSVDKIIMRLVKHGTPVCAVVMAMGLLYGLTLWSMCVCVWGGGGGGFGSNGFVINNAAIPNGWSV